MVHKTFWDDPYLTTLQTEVTRVVGNQVWLRDTIFFAQSGGQESDTGFLRDWIARGYAGEIFRRADPDAGQPLCLAQVRLHHRGAAPRGPG